jgi:hypothetical protein
MQFVRCMSPFMALFGHGAMSDLSPLSDQKRTYPPGQLLPGQRSFSTRSFLFIGRDR